MGIRLLVLGGGGREHTMVWKLAQSATIDDLFCAPGNPGTASLATNVELDPADPEAVRNWAEDNAIDLVVIGPEDPLAAGVGNELRAAGIPCLGPDKGAARIESSKIWAKRLMVESGVPTAAFEVFNDVDEAIEYLARIEYPAVVKADGLALGKGVVVARDFAAAEEAVRRMMTERVYGEAGAQILVEECLVGEELSAFAIADGEIFRMLPFARDYKQIGDGDLGPNTGGMGSYSPVALPDEAFGQTIERTVFEPILRALAESGNPYQGFLYAGLMLTAEGVKVIEFNARLGDPETQAILPLLGGDFADTAYLAARGRLAEANLEIISGSTCCVVMASEGYPADYETGFRIDGLSDVGDDLLIFQAGTSVRNEELVTSGGRVLAVVGLGDDLENARLRAYGALETVSFEGAYYRADIGATEQNGVGGGNA